ncbi:MAG: hypothetical protein AB7P00_29845 [Sandaracinaceae bacterium]
MARAWVAPACLALLILVSTGMRSSNDFVFDDLAVLVDGELVHHPERIGEVFTRHTMVASSADPGVVQPVDTYRPIPLASFMLDAWISGTGTTAFHVTDLVLHVLVSWLVFALAVRWLGREARMAALYGAALFAVHPWAVEAHVWINGRSDPLSAMFGLAAMLAWLRAEGDRKERAFAWRSAAGVSFLLGLLSKETLVTVVPLVLLMPPAAGTQLDWRQRLRSRGPGLAAATLIYFVARALVLGGLRASRDASMVADAATHFPWLVLDGLYHAVVPGFPALRSLGDEYRSLEAWQTALGTLSLVFLVALAIRWHARRPIAAWSIGWFVAPWVPIAVITTVLWPGFGRYLYLPLAGLAWALAEWVSRAVNDPRVEPRRRAVIALMCLHIGLYAAGAASFTMDFGDEDRLYRAAIEAHPEVAMGYGWLGFTREREGDHRAAAALFLRASELDPSTHRYLINLGRSELALGDRDAAARVAERGIERFADAPEEASYHLLAVNAMSSRDPNAAVGHLARCLEIWPDRPDCASALRFLLEEAPDREENRAALEAWRRR